MVESRGAVVLSVFSFINLDFSRNTRESFTFISTSAPSPDLGLPYSLNLNGELYYRKLTLDFAKDVKFLLRFLKGSGFHLSVTKFMVFGEEKQRCAAQKKDE